jgi:uncharacterized protein YpmB
MEMRSRIQSKRRKSRLWLIIPLVVVLVLAGLTVLFSISQAPLSDARKEYTNRAEATGKIVSVTDFYQTSRDGRYYTVVGKNASGEAVAAIFQDKTKGKSLVVKLKNGMTKSEVEKKIQSEYVVKKITSAGMAIYKGVAVWEVTFTDKKNNLNFVTVQFANGKVVRTILNF